MLFSELLAYTKRRLGITDDAVDELLSDVVLAEDLTDARDQLRQELAASAPAAIHEAVTLEAEGTTRVYKFPDAVADPMGVTSVRLVSSGRELTPAGRLDEDDGEYVWLTPRRVQVATGVPTGGGGVMVYAILMQAAFDVSGGADNYDDDNPEIGVPTAVQRCAGKGAAFLALSADEESDATNAEKAYEKEKKRLLEQYEGFDQMAGAALRPLMLDSAWRAHGDMMSR